MYWFYISYEIILWICIREAPGSNLDCVTGYRDWNFLYVSSLSPVELWCYQLQIDSTPPPLFRSFPIWPGSRDNLLWRYITVEFRRRHQIIYDITRLCSVKVKRPRLWLFKLQNINHNETFRCNYSLYFVSLGSATSGANWSVWKFLETWHN
jgi:hypothetical protein